MFFGRLLNCVLQYNLRRFLRAQFPLYHISKTHFSDYCMTWICQLHILTLKFKLSHCWNNEVDGSSWQVDGKYTIFAWWFWPTTYHVEKNHNLYIVFFSNRIRLEYSDLKKMESGTPTLLVGPDIRYSLVLACLSVNFVCLDVHWAWRTCERDGGYVVWLRMWFFAR